MLTACDNQFVMHVRCLVSEFLFVLAVCVGVCVFLFLSLSRCFCVGLCYVLCSVNTCGLTQEMNE